MTEDKETLWMEEVARGGYSDFTSESVTEGHPDKMCDQISDTILDAALAQDPLSRVAVECMCTKGAVIVAGEMTTKADLDINKIVRDEIRKIGYTDHASGFNADDCAVFVSIHEQSKDIALGTMDGVDGAGDQGMMFGMACTETPELMPLPIMLAHKIARTLSIKRKNKEIVFACPDGKTQVTVTYGPNGPVAVKTVVVSCQHRPYYSMDYMRRCVNNLVVKPVLRSAKQYNPDLDTEHYDFIFNPTGEFSIGGPGADTGLTGRKIIVDTYGGYTSHGGGAFSGKDPTKVDRSGAYMARYIAKNVVEAGISKSCVIQLAYAIGRTSPISINVCLAPEDAHKSTATTLAILELFDLTPLGIINKLNLRGIEYAPRCVYGHFGGINGMRCPWEETDMADALRTEVVRIQAGDYARFQCADLWRGKRDTEEDNPKE